MTNSEGSAVDLDALRELYDSDSDARALFDLLASRQRNRVKTSVDRLQMALANAGHDLARSDLIRIMCNLEEAGCGRFVMGRWNHPSRFEWDLGLIGVSRAAAGETDDIEELRGTEAEYEEEEEEEEEEEGLSHHYVLRREFTVQIKLPSDFTGAEANRLAEFIKTLPFE